VYYIYDPVKGRVALKKKDQETWKLVLRRGNREVYLGVLPEKYIVQLEIALRMKIEGWRHPEAYFAFLKPLVEELLRKKFGWFVMVERSVVKHYRFLSPRRGFLIVSDVEYSGIRGDLWAVYNKRRCSFQLALKRGYRVIRWLKYLRIADAVALSNGADPDKILSKYYSPYDFKVPARNSREDWGEEADLDEEELWGEEAYYSDQETWGEETDDECY
jgi:hypothetical protein